MPVLPQKRYAMSGNKKSGDELQNELVEYMRDLLNIAKVQRMFYIRLFLCMNSYPNISADTFNEMPAIDLMPLTNAYDHEHHSHINDGMIRESQDISYLVGSFRPSNTEDDNITFENSPVV